MPLHIREVTIENWRSVASLSVSEQQNQFIESNAFSLVESQFEENGISVGYMMRKLLLDLQCMAGLPIQLKALG